MLRYLQIILLFVFFYTTVFYQVANGEIVKMQEINYSDGINKKEAIKLAQEFLLNEKLDQEFNILKPTGVTLDRTQRLWTVAFAKRKEKRIPGFFSLNIGIRVIIEQDSGKIKNWGPNK